MTKQLNKLADLIERYYARDGLRAPLSAILSKSDDPITTSSTGIINTVYGAAVWNMLAREAKVWSLLPKKPWGNTGFRIVSAEPAALASGVAEEGAFPDQLEPTIDEVTPVPKWAVTHWALTHKAKFLSDADDGLKDTPAWYRKWAADAHVRGIDKMLMTDASAGVAGSNFESIDRVCCSYSEVSTITSQYTTSEGDIYGLDRDADTDGTYDAVVTHGAGSNGTEVVLSLAMIDEIVGHLRDHGAGERLIAITGYSTINKMEALCKTQFTSLQYSPFVKTINGVDTRRGAEGGLQVATYNGVPFFETPNAIVEPDVSTYFLPRIHFLDLDHVWIKVGIPTTYIATDPNEILLTDAFKDLHAYYTVGELVCDDFGKMGKIRDIKSA